MNFANLARQSHAMVWAWWSPCIIKDSARQLVDVEAPLHSLAVGGARCKPRKAVFLFPFLRQAIAAVG